MNKTSTFALTTAAGLMIGIIGAIGAITANAGHPGKVFGDGGADLPDFLKEFDINKDGQIDEEEKQAIRAARNEAKAARRAAVDTNNDGEISDEERAAAREKHLEKINEKRQEKFNEIAGQDGVIEPDEFVEIPALEGKNADRVNALFNRLDADDSNTITFDEFNARLRDHRGIRDRHHGKDKDKNKDKHRPGIPTRPAPPFLR